MTSPFRFKPSSRHMLYILGLLGLILAGLVVAGALGYRLRQDLMSEVTNGIMIAAVGVLLYNRKLRSDEVAAAKAAEDPKGLDDGDGPRR